MNKVRRWLIRRLLGVNKIDEALENTNAAVYKKAIEFLSIRLAEESHKIVSEFMAKTICDTEPKFMISFIQSHHKLSDSQKQAITAILTDDVADYIR